MKYGIELKEDQVLILPESRDYESKFGIILQREDKPLWKGSLVDSNSIEGINDGDTVLYNKNKGEIIVINDETHHVVNCDDVEAVIQ